MPGEHAVLGDARVVEEAIGSLGCSPVAARRRDRLAWRGRQLVQQLPQPTLEALVGQACGGKFAVLPASFAGHCTTAHL
jgi:hypothetical protein